MRRITSVDYEKLDGRAWDGGLLASGLRTDRNLARAAGLSPSTIYAARAGRVPPPETKRRIARALGLAVSTLWVRIVQDGGDAEVPRE
jgi:lambda repressor-like predicted transcriptional regulator